MAITLRNEEIARRWKGTTADVVEVAEEAFTLVTAQTGQEPTVSASVTAAGIETEFDSLGGLRTAFAGRAFTLSDIERVVITIGDFHKVGALSGRVEFTRPRKRQVEETMALIVRARGKERLLVDGLVEALKRKAEKGNRKIQFRTHLIQWPILAIYLVLQYFYLTYGPVPDLGPVGFYIYIIFVTILPTLVIIAAAKLLDWLVPPLELLPNQAKTRWEIYRTRTIAAATALMGMVAAAFIGTIFNS